MGKIIFEIVEDHYLKKLSSIQELSILFGMDSLFYMITDAQQRIAVLRETALVDSPAKNSDISHLKALLENDPYLQPTYRTTRVGFLKPVHTLIPDRLFNSRDKMTYLKQTAHLDDHSVEIKNDHLSSLNVQNIYSLDSSLISLIRKQFPGGKVFHGTSAFLDYFHHLASHLDGCHVFLHVWDRSLQLVLFEGKELHFINTFAYRSAKDFIYFVLLVFDQFKLSPDSVPLHLSGRLVEDSEVYRLLFRYIKNLEFLQPPALLQVGPKLAQHPKYFYFDLFCLYFCNLSHG